MNNNNNSNSNKIFGTSNDVFCAEPYWYRGFYSPYYNDLHRKFRLKVRNFVEKNIIPYVEEWDENGTYPKELHEKAYNAGILSIIYPIEYGGGLKLDDNQYIKVDPFFDLILIDELSRCGAGGILWAVFLNLVYHYHLYYNMVQNI